MSQHFILIFILVFPRAPVCIIPFKKYIYLFLRTGEGVFEVTKNLEQLRVKEKGQHDTFGPTRTLAEQKMDRNIKKLSKSIKIAKWNPNDWNIRGKLRKKINTRKWDDINVRPQWEEPSHSPPKDDGRREACETSSQPTLPRRTYQQPVLLPEKGSVFLKKSKQVFFSSLGRMHESCGTLTVSHPPVSPEPPKLPSPSTSLASSVSQEPSHTSEDSDNVVLVSSDSISISSNENVGESCEEEDTEVNNNLPHPVSDIADVFSSKIESPEQATEIVIEKEEHWDSDQMKDEEDLKTSITLRVSLHLLCGRSLMKIFFRRTC